MKKYEPGKIFDADIMLVKLVNRPGDPRLSILKLHLELEDILRTYVAQCVTHPQALIGARLTFPHVLALARALCGHIAPDYWIWDAIHRVNKLRNSMAHEDGSTDLAKDVDAFIEFWARNTDGLRPPFDTDRNARVEIVDVGPIYLLDVIGYALCQMLALYTGVKMENFELPPEHEATRKALLAGKLKLGF